VQFSAVAARRVASASPLSCQTSTQAPDGFGFPRRARLTRGDELQLVIREGKRVRTVHLDVRFAVSPLAVSRVGVVVPRHRHSAVDRNRLKRRLREIVRLELIPALHGSLSVDIAIRARKEAYSADMNALQVDVHAIAAGATATTGTIGSTLRSKDLKTSAPDRSAATLPVEPDVRPETAE